MRETKPSAGIWLRVGAGSNAQVSCWLSFSRPAWADARGTAPSCGWKSSGSLELFPHDHWIKCCAALSHRALFTVEFTETSSHDVLLLFIKLSPCLWVTWRCCTRAWRTLLRGGPSQHAPLQNLVFFSSVATGAVPSRIAAWWLELMDEQHRGDFRGSLSNFVKAEIQRSWG